MIEIRPNLFLSAIDDLPLKSTNIKAVLSLLTPPLSDYAQLNPLPQPHLHIPISDIPSACILKVLPQSLQFIHKNRRDGVLVHCYHGVSRSVATVLAYLIWTEPSISLEAHMKALRSLYPSANPSNSFVRQIAAFSESAIYAPDQYTFPPQCRKMQQLESYEYLVYVKQLPLDARTAALLPHPCTNSACAKCRRCRKPLLSTAGVLGHVDSQSILILPYIWTLSSYTLRRGKMRCPCGAKLGRFDWDDDPPRFEVHAAAVDWISPDCN